MSDLFFNKIAAAGLAAALGIIGINKIANVAVHADIPEVPAYSKYVAGESTTKVEVEAPFPQAEWIAGIDAVKGAKVFKKCTSCHNANEGGKNGTGPALWNVVGRAAGAGADFNYSPAMANSGLTWNYAELDGYLENPKTYLPKNKMAFIGVKKASDRAAVIEYLRLASNAPLVALTEAAPIPGMDAPEEGGHIDEAHVEEAAVEDGAVEVPAEVQEVIEGAVDAPADTQEAIEEGVETPAQVEEIVEDVVDAPAEVQETVEEIVEEVVDTPVEVQAPETVEEIVEEIQDAVPAPEPEDGGN